MNALNSSLVFLLIFLEEYHNRRIQKVQQHIPSMLPEIAPLGLYTAEQFLRRIEVADPVLSYRPEVNRAIRLSLKAAAFNHTYGGGTHGFRMLTASIGVPLLSSGSAHRYNQAVWSLNTGTHTYNDSLYGKRTVAVLLEQMSSSFWNPSMIPEERLLQEMSLQETKSRLMFFNLGRDQIIPYPYGEIKEVE